MLDKWDVNIFTHQGLKKIDEIEEIKETKKKEEKKKILENDLTKALVNTIVYSKKARETFVDILKEKRININEADISENNIELFTTKVEKKSNSVLLLIKSKYKRDEIEDLDKIQKESKNNKKVKDKTAILDALIVTKKKNIGIEVKLHAKVEKNQIKKEMELLGNKQLIEIYWEDIHNKMKEKLKDNQDDIILKNFVNFLEMINMTHFMGIPFAYEYGKPEENYTEEKAKEILKQIKNVILIQEQKEIKNLEFKMKKGTFTTIYYKKNNTEPHYSIYIFKEYFGIDLYFEKNVNVKFKKSLINNLEDIYKEHIKAKSEDDDIEDQTWFIEIFKYRGYRSRKDLAGCYYNPNETDPGYDFEKLSLSLDKISMDKNGSFSKKYKQFFLDLINEEMRLRIERRFYYNNPFYSCPYEKKDAKGKKICKVHMNSENFKDKIIETLIKLSKIRKFLKKCKNKKPM